MSPRENKWHWFSPDDNSPCYPLVQSIIIILYWMFCNSLSTSSILRLVSKHFQVKWIFVFVFSSPFIQTLIRHQSESMVNRMRINSAQSIFFGISPVAKSHHVLGLVLWFSGWYTENNIWQNLYNTPYQPSTNISGWYWSLGLIWGVIQLLPSIILYLYHR